MNMNHKLLLCLALVLSGGSFGCSTAAHRSAGSSKPDLYLHLIASYEYPKPPQLTASVPIYLSTNFDFLANNQQHLTGRVESRNGKYFAHFQIYLYDGTNVFDGEVELDKPDNPGTHPYNDKTPFIYQPLFILSRNSSAESFLKRQAAADKKEWRRWNPLTPQQIVSVKRKFNLMRPGMTENEAFAMVGLSSYRNCLLDPRMFRSNDWNSDDYQLADGEILSLEVDCSSISNYKTNFIYGDHSNCIVVHAVLGTETWSKDAGFGTTSLIRQ
jgi:hypothetical protein